MSKCYVYKIYGENNELLYIGKTSDFENRMSTHMRDQPWKSEICTIYRAKCKSKTDMDLYEIFYINTLKPKYNVTSVNDDMISVNLPDLIFTQYKFVRYKNWRRPRETRSFIKVYLTETPINITPILYELLLLMDENNTLTLLAYQKGLIAKKLDISESSVNHNITKMVNSNILSRIGRGTYKVSDELFGKVIKK